MSRVFPEITRGSALELLGEMKRDSSRGVALGVLQDRLVRIRAVPPATGGRVATESEMYDLVDRVDKAMAPLLGPQGEVHSTRVFDVLLGKILHDRLDISHATASREGTWSFLTLALFPHLLVARFPDPAVERAVGRPRNVLRRVWVREDVLGELMRCGTNGLREDELVQITERTALVRTPALAQHVATAALARPADPGREQFTRKLVKEVVRRSGPVLLDALDSSQLRDLVQECAARVAG